MNLPALFSSLLQRARRSARADPARDWIALISLSVIALAGIVVLNLWTFGVVAGGGAIGGAQAKTALSLAPDRASLDAIRAIFEKRAAEKGQYSSGAYRYADPSQ